MTLQQVWQESRADKSNSFFVGNKSLFTIQNGCKIERFDETGEILIWNTRLGNMFYKKVDDVSDFLLGGWHYGTYMTSLKTFQLQVNELNKVIANQLAQGQSAEVKQLQRKNLLIKIHEINNIIKQRFEHINSDGLSSLVLDEHDGELNLDD